LRENTYPEPLTMFVRSTVRTMQVSKNINKNSSGDEIVNVNFYAVRPKDATRIRWNSAK